MPSWSHARAAAIEVRLTRRLPRVLRTLATEANVVVPQMVCKYSGVVFEGLIPTDRRIVPVPTAGQVRAGGQAIRLGCLRFEPEWGFG